MQRFLACLILTICALVALPALASADDDNGRKRTRSLDVVIGFARFDAPVDATVTVVAFSGPTGQNPRGFFTVRQGPPTNARFRAIVTCLTVVGNRAVVGGRIVQSSNPAQPVGGGALQHVEDNRSTGMPDRSFSALAASPPTTCPAPGAGGIPVTRGGYGVRNALP